MRLLTSLVVLSGMAFLIFSRVEKPEYGAISGRVTDETGAPISGAKVSARNQARSLTFHAGTDLSGNYRISSLPQGRYSVWAEAPKHHSRMLYGVIVNRGEELRIDVVLPCCREDLVVPTAVDDSRNNSARPDTPDVP
jgi:hypothetical protein